MVEPIPESVDMPTNPTADPQQEMLGIQQKSASIIRLPQERLVELPPVQGEMAISKKDLQKITEICSSARKTRLHWADLFLGLASLFAGAFITGLISGFPYDVSFQSILSFNISPAIAVGSSVAFFFSRKNEHTSVKSMADHILEYIPEELLKLGDKT